MLVDCGSCSARPIACADCVVTALLDGPQDGQLTADEVAAMDALAAGGLVSPLRFVRAV
jgi:hypothetical protein